MARRTPATSPQQRENQLIAKAVDLAERQIEDGTVSAQVLSYYVKRGSTREKLEEEMVALRNEHLRAQTEALAAAGRIEELIQGAVEVFKGYASGINDPDVIYDPSQIP